MDLGKLTISDYLGIGLFLASMFMAKKEKEKERKQLPISKQPLPGVRTPREEELQLLPGDEGLVPRIEKKWGDIARDVHKIYPNVPVSEILRFIHIESRGQKDAYDEVSDAYGLLQLTPVAQQQYSVIDPLDPWDNIEGGVHMISDLHEIYEDKPVYVAAAFFEWPNDLTGLMQSRSIAFDPETMTYVKRAMNLQRLYDGVK